MPKIAEVKMIDGLPWVRVVFPDFMPAAVTLYSDEEMAALNRRHAAALAASEADAARYRWLRARDLDAVHSGGVFIGETPKNVVLNLDDADAAIDAAIAKEQEGR